MWLCTGSLYAADAQHQTKDERLFKAAFIYNFAKFTDWPKNTPGHDGDLILCTAGKNALVDDLKQLGGKIIKGRKLSIRQLQDEQSPDRCHILYIANSEKNRYLNILKATNGKPILTVSELGNFAHQGGIIQFYRDKGQTRLIINLDAAGKARVEISSRLLILTEVINGKETP